MSCFINDLLQQAGPNTKGNGDSLLSRETNQHRDRACDGHRAGRWDPLSWMQPADGLLSKAHVQRLCSKLGSLKPTPGLGTRGGGAGVAPKNRQGCGSLSCTAPLLWGTATAAKIRARRYLEECDVTGQSGWDAVPGTGARCLEQGTGWSESPRPKRDAARERDGCLTIAKSPPAMGLGKCFQLQQFGKRLVT